MRADEMEISGILTSLTHYAIDLAAKNSDPGRGEHAYMASANFLNLLGSETSTVTQAPGKVLFYKCEAGCDVPGELRGHHVPGDADLQLYRRRMHRVHNLVAARHDDPAIEGWCDEIP
jgi:hypothetical protein